MENQGNIKPKDRQGSKYILIFYKYFYFISLVIFVAIVIVGLLVLIIPKYKIISGSLEVEDEEKRMEFDHLNKYLVELTKYKSSYAKISQEDIKRIDSMLPEMSDPEELFTEMESLVKRNGLFLNSIEIKPKTEKNAKTAAKKASSQAESSLDLPEGIEKIEISLDISGTNYKSMKNFLRTLENSLRFFDVHDLSFGQGSNTLSLNLTTYVKSIRE